MKDHKEYVEDMIDHYAGIRINETNFVKRWVTGNMGILIFLYQAGSDYGALRKVLPVNRGRY